MSKNNKLDVLFDPEIMPDNLAGNKKIAELAKQTVIDKFEEYDNARTFTRAGQEVNTTEDWDESYRIYKAVYNQGDHSYKGNAKTFTPALRKDVNVIESEASNALFSRDDYFSVDPIGKSSANVDMARRSYKTLEYFSNKEEYVSDYEIAVKQALIYNCTAVETVYSKEHMSGVFRKLDLVPITDPETGDLLVDPETGSPLPPNKEYNIYEINQDFQSVKIKVRDIYRLYLNHLSNDPEEHDMIYQDSMTEQELLENRERGVYDKKAVDKLLKMTPRALNSTTENTNMDGEGKTFIDTVNQQAGTGSQSESRHFEVLRFQGLFTTIDQNTKKTIKEQYWIDIGERDVVLRVIKNPLLGQPKTFSVCNYDTMYNEFYSDSVISPNKDLQYVINDKENQSLDGLTFELNAPFEVLKSSGVRQIDILRARKNPNHAIMVNTINSVRKIETRPPLAHLNTELQRINNILDSTTGATNVAAGAPTGTQVDRSGKAIGLLQAQSRSQFSKFIRKVERKLIQRSLQKAWDIIVQFFDDEIEIEIQGDDGKISAHAQPVNEIVGRFNVRVTAGSEFLKERERRDSIMEFLSIVGMSDEFMGMIDKEKMLKDIAAAMPFNMEQYIDPEALLNRQKSMIQSLQQTLEAAGVRNETLMSEVNRLVGVVKQTDRAQESVPPVTDIKGQAAQQQAKQQQGAGARQVAGATGLGT